MLRLRGSFWIERRQTLKQITLAVSSHLVWQGITSTGSSTPMRETIRRLLVRVPLSSLPFHPPSSFPLYPPSSFPLPPYPSPFLSTPLPLRPPLLSTPPPPPPPPPPSLPLHPLSTPLPLSSPSFLSFLPLHSPSSLHPLSCPSPPSIPPFPLTVPLFSPLCSVHLLISWLQEWHQGTHALRVVQGASR